MKKTILLLFWISVHKYIRSVPIYRRTNRKIQRPKGSCKFHCKLSYPP